MRISGLASGFDTEEMVRQLMQAERVKVDRVEQNRQIILWRQESYNNINKQFANFILNTQKDMGLKRASSTGSLFDNSYKNLDYVKKATSSNETVATVTSTGKTVNGSFEIVVGENVPKNATFTSAKIGNFNLEGVTELSFNIDGHEVNVSNDGKQLTMDDIAKAINGAKVMTYKRPGEDEYTEISKAEFDELSEGEQKKVKETPLEITAFYDKGTGRIFMESSEGEEIKITANGDSKGADFVDAVHGEGYLSDAGHKGDVKINGVSVDVKNGKVEFNGLIIDIKAEGTTRINVSTNTEGIMEKIEKLIADYNDLVDLASGLVNEKVYSTYKPLSQEERKALSEADLKLWDEKAKSGLLNRDENLQRTLQNIRTDLYKTLEGKTGSFDHITQIGISTESYAKGSAGGKLQIDTDKLRKAIEEDAEGVMELLFKEPTATKYDGIRPIEKDYDPNDFEGKTYDQALKDYNDGLRAHNIAEKAHRNGHSGIFTRVYDGLIDGMKAIIDKSGPGNDGDLYRSVRSNMLIDFVTSKSSISDLDKSVTEMNRKIDNLNILLAKREESHYAKFTAMEKAMYQMQNQSSWLSQQFQF